MKSDYLRRNYERFSFAKVRTILSRKTKSDSLRRNYEQLSSVKVRTILSGKTKKDSLRRSEDDYPGEMNEKFSLTEWRTILAREFDEWFWCVVEASGIQIGEKEIDIFRKFTFKWLKNNLWEFILVSPEGSTKIFC